MSEPLTPRETKTARRRGLTLIAAAVVVVGMGWGAWDWFSGRHFESTDNAYVAGNVVQITPQVAGTVVAIGADDTDHVQTGQTLVRLDPADARIALDQAQAQLAQAGATATRYKPLVAANAVSQQEYDAAVAAEKAAQAQVAAGKAAVRTAGINLGYATVTAPISGRIGRALVTEGALVNQQQDGGTALAVVQQIDPLYINITQSANQVLQLREALAAGRLTRASGAEAAKVQVLLDNGQPFGQSARLLFTDLSVDPATGEVSLRAELPNPGGRLLPGMYVRVRVEQAQVEHAILLPQQAVTRGTRGDSVMVVAADGSVAPRPVTVRGAQGQDWIVTDGLRPGEQVMVEGAMKLMLGAKVVKPVPWQPKSAVAPAGQAPAAPKSGAFATPASAPASAASN